MYPIVAPVFCINSVYGLEISPYLAGSFRYVAVEERI